MVGGAYPLINPDAANLGGAHVRIKVRQFPTSNIGTFISLRSSASSQAMHTAAAVYSLTHTFRYHPHC